MSTLALDFTKNDTPVSMPFIANLCSLIKAVRTLEHLDLAMDKGISWLSLPYYASLPCVRSLVFDGFLASNVSDVRAISTPFLATGLTLSTSTQIHRWEQLACLLSFFPDLRRLEVSGFNFRDLAFSRHRKQLQLEPSFIAVRYPVLCAILQYLRYRSGFREFVLHGYPGVEERCELRATRTCAEEDFKLERWAIMAAEHDMFLEVF